MPKSPQYSRRHYVAFKLTDDMRDQLLAVAKELDTTVSGVIRLMINDALKRKITGAKIQSK
jgi:antitoxin component of RelBE/YafQ-DinJ toxin-antitoxin module